MPVPGSAASSGDGGGFSARLGGSDELDGASGLMFFLLRKAAMVER